MTEPTYSNIVATFDLASCNDTLEGRRWYADALKIAGAMAAQFNVHPMTAAGVIAALSPNNRWERNVQDAENVIRAWVSGGADAAMNVKACTYGAMKKKAVDILEAGDFNVAQARTILDILNGRKIKAFFGCIIELDPNDPRLKKNETVDVCVDGHAYGIWQGDRLSMKDVPSIGVKLYATIADEYRQAAAFINERDDQNYSPAEIQAITWVAWRRLHSV